MTSPRALRAACIAALLTVATPVAAVDFNVDVQDLAQANLPADAQAGVAAPTPPADAPVTATPSAFGPALDADRLDGMRGGDGNTHTTTNQADVRGRVDGNSATNVLGQGSTISDGSFGNAAGISTVIQNSGSNVLIQNSTIVNVQFVDPTP